MSDLISRKEAIDALMREREKLLAFGMDGAEHILTHHAFNIISELPSARPERKTGRWILGKCNLCGGHAPFWPLATTYYQSDYCPNCGADMREDGE